MDKDNRIKLDEFSESVSQHFTAAGATFMIPPARIAAKLKHIRALIFDWDGVFNEGFKGGDLSSAFGEADSMGINMLRYGFWRKNHQLPAVAVISGQDNHTVVQFALRERLHNVYLGIRDKLLAVRHLCWNHKIKPDQIVCIFDDINDLGMAKICGLRCLVNRPASPLFRHYVSEYKLCDYITGCSPGHHAVREFSELFLGLMGLFETVVASRIDCDQAYQDYFNHRQAISTQFYTQQADKIVTVSKHGNNQK